MAETKIVSLGEFKVNRYKTDQMLDATGQVELQQVFFDKISWTTPRAIQIQKGKKRAWIARKIIDSVELSETEPCSLWMLSWGVLEWKE